MRLDVEETLAGYLAGLGIDASLKRPEAAKGKEGCLLRPMPEINVEHYMDGAEACDHIVAVVCRKWSDEEAVEACSEALQAMSGSVVQSENGSYYQSAAAWIYQEPQRLAPDGSGLYSWQGMVAVPILKEQ